jgi:hypothetical protein
MFEESSVTKSVIKDLKRRKAIAQRDLTTKRKGITILEIRIKECDDLIALLEDKEK